MGILSSVALVVAWLCLGAAAGASPSTAIMQVERGWPASGYSLADVTIEYQGPVSRGTTELITIFGAGTGRWSTWGHDGDGVLHDFVVTKEEFAELHEAFFAARFFAMDDYTSSWSTETDAAGLVTVFFTETDGAYDKLCFVLSDSTKCVRWLAEHDPPAALVELGEKVIALANENTGRGQ